MPSKAELEQEIEVLEAEADEHRRTIAQLRGELDEARGHAAAVTSAAEDAGVALAVPMTPAEQERGELATIRKGIEGDIQAIEELRNPQPLDTGKAESALEIVRANQRERHELNERLAASTTIVSRVAAVLGVPTWDAEGTEIRDLVQRYAHLPMLLKRRRNLVLAEIDKLSKQAKDERAELAGWLRAIDWVVEQLRAPEPDAGLLSPRELFVNLDEGNGGYCANFTIRGVKKWAVYSGFEGDNDRIEFDGYVLVANGDKITAEVA